MSVWTDFAITLAIALAICAVAAIATRLTLAPSPFWRGGRGEGRSAEGFAARTANVIFILLFLAYCAVFGTLSLLRHNSFHSGGYDLGIFDQAIWNSLNGRLLENTIMIDSPSLLGHHWSPLLIGIVPLYALWSNVQALLIFQTFALASGSLPLYWFARKRLGYPFALVIVALYFLYPALEYVNLFEFHEIALVTPLLAFALFFLLNQRLVPFLICLGLTLMLKEEMAFVATAFGIYLFFVERRRALGVILAVGGLVWGYALISYLIPYFQGPDYGGTYFFVERYTYLGKTVSQIINNAVTKPWLVLEHLLLPQNIEFVLQLLVPLAFIPVIGIEIFALALPTLFYLLASDFPSQSSIHFQYTAPLIPFMFFSLVIGIQRIARWRIFSRFELARVQTLILILVLASGIANYFFQSPGPSSRSMDAQEFTATAHTQIGYQLLSMIPPNATVMADSNLVPHLSQRLTVYQTAVVPDLRQIDYLLSDATLPIHADYESIWNDILPLPFFETVSDQDGYILKKRAAVKVAQPRPLQFDNGISLIGYTIESNQPMRRGDTANLVLAWRADEAIDTRYAVFVHLRDAAGNLWAQDDHEPGKGWLRTDRWQAGDETMDGYALKLPAYMPPGEYSISAGLYRLDNGARLRARDERGEFGDEPLLGMLQVGKEFTPVDPGTLDIAQPQHVKIQYYEFLGSTVMPDTVFTDDSVDVGLYWHTLRKPYYLWSAEVALLDSNGAGNPITRLFDDTRYPPSDWAENETVLQWYNLKIPPETASGTYQVAVLMSAGPVDHKLIKLGSIKVEQIQHQFKVPAISNSLSTNFGKAIKLLGYDIARDNDKLTLTLYWQCAEPMPTSYTVFLHALDAHNQILAQQDQLPVGGKYPTTRWVQSEVIRDTYALTLPSSANTPTQIELGWYDAANGQRLAQSDGSDHLLLNLAP